TGRTRCILWKTKSVTSNRKLTHSRSRSTSSLVRRNPQMFSDVPVLGALLRALQSRKVVISLVAIIFSYLVTLVPELEAVREQLTAGLFFVITVVVTALSG